MAKYTQKQPKFGVLDNLPDTHTSTSTHAPTHTHTHAPVYTQEQDSVVEKKVVVKERKTRRVQLLLKESAVNGIDRYAKDHDTSRNDIMQKLIDDFLIREGYTEEK